MTQAYEFIIGPHNEQAHDYTSALIDEAYKRKAGGSPTASNERVNKADELCEAYYAQMDDKPAQAVLSRLAWYVIFDEMVDTHPDKMTREEYPILSDWQAIERRESQFSISDIEFGDRRGNGRRKSHFVGDNGYVGVSNNKMPERESPEIERIPNEMDVNKMLDGAKLTGRQRKAIDLVFFEGMTQVQAGEVMGVNKSNVNEYIKHGLSKIKKNFKQSS